MMTQTVGTNGVGAMVGGSGGVPSPSRVPSRKAKGQAGQAKAPSAKVKSQQAAALRAERWAHWYTGSAIVLSSGLNAYAAVRESGQSGYGSYAAAGIGAAIPVLVWMLGTVTAWTYRAGFRRLALVSGAVAACVLALSVVHVAGALAALTGTSGFLAALLAIGIDCGLVSSEATAIMVTTVE